MAVLCDTQIRELVGIEPFEESGKRQGVISYGVSSYGYDVRVGTRFKVLTNATSGGAAIVDPKSFTPELWTQFLGGQTPLMQNLMNPYLEQSKVMFDRLQEQIQKGALFPGVGGFKGPPDKE